MTGMATPEADLRSNREYQTPRREPRHQLSDPIPAAVSELVGAAEIADLSMNGLKLLTGSARFTDGAGLQLRFKLPIGCSIQVTGAVRWSKPMGSQIAHGIEFVEIDKSNRFLLSRYLQDFLIPGAEDRLSATVSEKYAVHMDPAGRVRIALNGYLTPNEAVALERAMRDLLRGINTRTIRFEIDARLFAACSKPTLNGIKACFDLFLSFEDRIGVLVSKRSIATSQLLRLARESHIADSLVVLEDDEQVAAFWVELEDTVGCSS